MKLSSCLFVLQLFLSCSVSSGFLVLPQNNPARKWQATMTSNDNDKNTNTVATAAAGSSSSSSSSSSRRDFFDTTASSVLATSTLLTLLTTTTFHTEAAWAADADSDTRPFCIIGANGKTGTKCVQECLNRGFAVRATSRSGIYNDQEEVVLMTNTNTNANSKKSNLSLFSAVTCDVKDPSTITAAIAGSRAVIFAASASKQGGSSSQVDNVGLVNVAQACIRAHIPHLVIVSSGGVSKPDSLTYQFLNRVAGGIMEEKIKGEDTVRALYQEAEAEAANAATDDSRSSKSTRKTISTYTVIRPGGLTEEPARGVSALALNQGDTVSGRISRYDVASLCIASTLYPQFTSATTFECYDADTGKSINTVGFSNIMKQKTTTTNDDDAPNERERRGSTFDALFRGLERDY